MTVLMWDKPKKARSAEKHADMYSADGAPPGCYAPNMSEEDTMRWKAKFVNLKTDYPQVELRRNGVVVVIGLRGYKYKFYNYRMTKKAYDRWAKFGEPERAPTVMHIATSGPMRFTLAEFEQFQAAIAEGFEALKNLKVDE